MSSDNLFREIRVLVERLWSALELLFSAYVFSIDIDGDEINPCVVRRSGNLYY